MLMEWQERTLLQLGKEKHDKLTQAHIFIVGLGGVGGACAESLVRAGIGELSILDADVISPSNINRQLIASQDNIGKKKIDLWKERLLAINPDLKLHTSDAFLTFENIDKLFPQSIDYVADAIDTLNPKTSLIAYTIQQKVPLISSLGSGGKMDASQIQVADISKSYGCRFGRMVRKRLHKENIRSGFKVVFSPEHVPSEILHYTENEKNKKTTTGTISYMPILFGNFMAAEIIRVLTRVG